MSQPARTAPRPGGTPRPRRPARPVTAGRTLHRSTALRAVPAAIAGTGHLFFAAMCIAVMVLGLIGLLALNTAIGQDSVELQRLENASASLSNTEAALTQAVDAARSPHNLAAHAAALGMVPAGSMAFISLSDGKISGQANPAPKPVKPAVTTPAPTTTAAPATTSTSKPATTSTTKPSTASTSKPATTSTTTPTSASTAKPSTGGAG